MALRSCASLFLRRSVLPLQTAFVSSTSSDKPKTVKAKLMVGDNVDYEDMAIVHVKATYNNTLVTLTDHLGLKATCQSAGMVGFKKAKRSSSYAGQVTGESVASRAVELGVKKVRVKVNGLGPGRQTAVKGLLAGGLEIVSITDITPVPHNGMRPRKQRRL